MSSWKGEHEQRYVSMCIAKNIQIFSYATYLFLRNVYTSVHDHGVTEGLVPDRELQSIVN